MKLSKDMKAAINQYWAWKYADRKSPGFFVEPQIKERCLDELFRQAKRSKLHCEVSPGIIFLFRREQKLVITSPVWMLDAP